MAGSRTLKLSILADVDNLKKNLDAGSKEVDGFGGKLEKFSKVAAAAFAAAAAAAVAYAGKLAIDGVKAAIEDEAAQNRLANALKNVTGATDTQIASVEKQISQMSLAFGVADDQLRPAYQRLATATGDLSQAEKGLQLALDISAATGKSVEAVANALGKAYEGNTGALGRLGIGLSTAEIKSLGLDGTMKQLADTFGGAATVQANTLEGQIARLKVGFDEAKESVGAALLPIIQKLMDYIVNVFIPKIQEAKKAAVDPIIVAFKNNEAALRDLWSFIKNYLVPIFETTLVNAIGAVGKVIAGVINIIGAVVSGIKALANDVIDFINRIISAYNKLPLPNIGLISKIGSSGGSSTGTGGSGAGSTIQIPGGGSVTIPSVSAPSSTAVTTSPSITPITATTASVTEPTIDITGTPSLGTSANELAATRYAAQLAAINAANAATNDLDASRYTAMLNGIQQNGVTIVVQAPSIIDENGFSEAVTDALNRAYYRYGGGGAQLAL